MLDVLKLASPHALLALDSCRIYFPSSLGSCGKGGDGFVEGRG